MPVKLISKFASTMGASQRNQINNLLQEGAESGNFETGEDFMEQLEALSNLISSTAAPVFTFFEVGGLEVVDNGRLNRQFRFMQLDMETVYTELSAIQDSIAGHQVIMDQKIIDIKNAIAALDTRINSLDVLRAESDFSLIQYNSFNTLGADGLPLSDSNAGALYYDDRQNIVMSAGYLCEVNIQKEGLVLPNTPNNLNIVGVELLEGQGSSPVTYHTTVSDLDVSPTSNTLSKILIEDTQYWIHSVLVLDENQAGDPIGPPSSGVQAALRIRLGGFNTINNLVLAPYTGSNIEIRQIDYHTLSDAWERIPIGPSLSSVMVTTEAVSILFNSIQTDELIIQIGQTSYSDLSDFYYDAAPENTLLAESLTSAPEVSEQLVGPGADPTTSNQYAKGYFYSIGFDYIGINRIDYDASGIYVSKPLISTAPLVEVALRANINHSQIISPITGSLVNNDSVEFRILKQDFNSSGALVNVTNVPIPNAYDNGFVNGESLISTTGGTGMMRMYPHVDPASNVITLEVFQDGASLTLGANYELSNDNGSTWETTYGPWALPSNAISPFPRMFIKILSFSNASNYTYDYQVHSEVALDSTQTIKMLPNSIKFQLNTDLTQTFDHSLIFLKTIMRSWDLLSTRSTPVILDYALLAQESSS